MLAPALERPPCYVAFSGGRDSSALLAAATALARREGLDDPIPVTERYGDLAEADEGRWQHLLLDHLGIREWIVLDVGGRSDLLGEVAQRGLLERGVVWPPALQIKPNMFSALSPGSLVTGEGGDEVFGPRRVTPWLHLARWTRGGRLRAARGAGESLLPRRLRASLQAARLRSGPIQPWLRRPLRDLHLRLVAEDLASEPMRWDRSLPWLCRRRSAVVAEHNYRLLAAEHGLELINPFLDPRFLAALARLGGRLGFATRAQVMREMFADVVPSESLERSTKALFNRAFMGEPTRRFAESWDGTGVDEEWIDADRLRAEWLSESPSAISSVALQQAWLASNAPAPPFAAV